MLWKHTQPARLGPQEALGEHSPEGGTWLPQASIQGFSAGQASGPGEPLSTLHESYGLVSQQRKHDLNVGCGVQSQVLSFSF